MAHAAERLPITIDGRSYLIDVEEYNRTTVPTLREQRDTSSEAGEQRLNTQFWVRSQTDWSLGAGQEYFDNDDSDRRRFYTSSGIDPWTKGQVSLLPICEDKGNTGNDVIMKVFTSGSTDYMYVASGTNLYFSTNFNTASPTWSTVTALGTPATHLRRRPLLLRRGHKSHSQFTDAHPHLTAALSPCGDTHVPCRGRFAAGALRAAAARRGARGPIRGDVGPRRSYCPLSELAAPR